MGRVGQRELHTSCSSWRWWCCLQNKGHGLQLAQHTRALGPQPTTTPVIMAGPAAWAHTRASGKGLHPATTPIVAAAPSAWAHGSTRSPPQPGHRRIAPRQWRRPWRACTPLCPARFTGSSCSCSGCCCCTLKGGGQAGHAATQQGKQTLQETLWRACGPRVCDTTRACIRTRIPFL